MTAVDSGRIVAALAKRHRPPAWALLEQVGNGTGAGCNRYADALALSLWPSRGIDLHGFEVKVHRGDWLRELQRPDKAEDIADTCDFWWIAAAPGVVDLERDQIPTAWGVLVLDGRGMVQRKKAERRENRAELDRLIVAAILRRATERMVPLSSIATRLEEARAEGEQRARDRVSRDDGARALAELRASVQAFELASGLLITDYNGERLGAQVGRIGALEQLNGQGGLRSCEADLVRALEFVRRASGAVKA